MTEDDAVAALRPICTALPDVVEEQAWLGTRWRVRGRTFAHVLTIDHGHPAAYARAAGTDGPLTVLMFRSSGEELDALRSGDHRCFAPRWREDELGLALGDDVDLAELAELVTESYCLLAPKKLSAKVERPEVDVEQ